MRKDRLKNRPVLSSIVKQELLPLLLESDPDCVIGIGIRLYLERDNNIDELIIELQNLIYTNPGYMTSVIGPQAMRLLYTGYDVL